MAENKFLQPFVKWAGGKRQLLPEILPRIPKNYSRYYEPFVGGGAVLFSLRPKKFVINDKNKEIINVYRTIQENVDSLIKELKTYKNDSDFYYKKRDLDRNKNFEDLPAVKRAARILYLNKTCYNGLFRVNRQGQFNVPFGNYKNPNFVNEFTLRAVSKFLNEANCRIDSGDYLHGLKGIRKGSFVYFDPPYDPVSTSASFTGYTLTGFDKQEQVRLKQACDQLHNKGCKFLLSNSATDFIKDLYKDYTIDIVHARRNINSDSAGRGKIAEVLIRNYDI